MKTPRKRTILALLAPTLLASCAGLPPTTQTQPATLLARAQSREVVMYALGLIGADYRFGGRNPEAGLDCSGMVSYIYEQAVGLKLPHNAALIARLGREIEVSALQPGDLVFFNTLDRPFSHVGIYVGDGRFVHAPARDGKVKISSLKSGYYAKRLEAARSFFD
jgi:cell wall-associated NlpC family hydrolase